MVMRVRILLRLQYANMKVHLVIEEGANSERVMKARALKLQLKEAVDRCKENEEEKVWAEIKHLYPDSTTEWDTYFINVATDIDLHSFKWTSEMFKRFFK
jgi:hypothetical protein